MKRYLAHGGRRHRLRHGTLGRSWWRWWQVFFHSSHLWAYSLCRPLSGWLTTINLASARKSNHPTLPVRPTNEGLLINNKYNLVGLIVLLHLIYKTLLFQMSWPAVFCLSWLHSILLKWKIGRHENFIIIKNWSWIDSSPHNWAFCFSLFPLFLLSLINRFVIKAQIRLIHFHCCNRMLLTFTKASRFIPWWTA